MEKPIPVFILSTLPKPEGRLKGKGKREKERKFFSFPFYLFPFAFSLLLSGCVSNYTYPADKVPESIETLCRDEYKLNVTARVVGKTVGALLYVDELIDTKGQIPKDVHESMGRVLQVVARVALSTELPLDFCSIVIRDKKSTNELTITRSLDDTRRGNAEALGVEESINRTLFGQGRYAKDAVGNSPFILKEVRLENFLADQIVQRIRYSFSRETAGSGKKGAKKKEVEEEDEDNSAFILVDGVFEDVKGRKDYRFSILSMKSEDPKQSMLNVFKTVNDVLSGYEFTGFDQIEIQDYINRQKLVLDRETLLSYQKKKIKDEDILKRFLQESQSVQEAFKLFGFSGPVSDQTQSPAEPAATPPNP